MKSIDSFKSFKPNKIKPYYFQKEKCLVYTNLKNEIC